MHLVTLNSGSNMCIRPNRLDCGTEVGCRKCWQCRKRRVDDLVGRCIAESNFSEKSYAITLTYKPQVGVNAVTLVYKDIQDFLKRIRKHYKCRYIVTGEYGSAKGRAHWHVILFFKDDYPEVDQNKRVQWKYWPHGFSYFQEPDWKGFQYCLKYVLKDQDEQRQHDSHLAMSKKPPLGSEYFEYLADEHVKQALSPQTYFYKFGDVRDSKNRDKRFMITGTTRKNFMERFLQKWEDIYDDPPVSEIVDEYIDSVTEIEYTDDELMQRLHHKPVRYVQPEVQMDLIKTQNHKYIQYDLLYEGIPIVVWEYPTKIHIITETDEWHEERGEVIRLIKKRSKQLRKQSLSDIMQKELDDQTQD